MTREEKFTQAMQKRKEEKIVEEERRGGGSYVFEPVPYCALETNQVKVVRLLGLPNHVKETPFDAKIINVSMITGDNDKPFRCIWPLKEERPDWIMWRIFDRVMEYEWDSGSNSKIYKHKDAHPAIFQKVFKNNKPHITFEKGWKPSTMVLLNMLDRMGMEWHEENKKSKVLSKKVKESVKTDGTSQFWYDVGVPKMLYDLILDDIVTHFGDWTNYDIAITKLSDKPFYKVAYLLKRKEEFKPEVVEFAFDGLLTNEQESYELNDLDRLFKLTTYKKLENRLKVFIQQVDSVFNTTYYDELVVLVEKEKKEDAEKKAEETPKSDNTSDPVLNPAPTPDPTSTPTPAPVSDPVRQTRTKKEEPKEISKLDKLNKLGFAGVAKLTEKEIDLISEINSDAFVYSSKEQESHCPSCDFKAPMDFHCCPKCGEEFE